MWGGGDGLAYTVEVMPSTPWTAWSGAECGAFVAEVARLPQYRAVAEASFTGRVLARLQMAHLSAAGVTNFDHQKAIMRAVNLLRDPSYPAKVRALLHAERRKAAAVRLQAWARQRGARARAQALREARKLDKLRRTHRAQSRVAAGARCALLGQGAVFEVVGGFLAVSDHARFGAACASALELLVQGSLGHLQTQLAARRAAARDRGELALRAVAAASAPLESARAMLRLIRKPSLYEVMLNKAPSESERAAFVLASAVAWDAPETSSLTIDAFRSATRQILQHMQESSVVADMYVARAARRSAPRVMMSNPRSPSPRPRENRPPCARRAASLSMRRLCRRSDRSGWPACSQRGSRHRRPTLTARTKTSSTLFAVGFGRFETSSTCASSTPSVNRSFASRR